MATKTVKYDSFKRGDTPIFEFVYSPPYVGFSWTGIVADIAMTDVEDPANNSGAAIYRTAVALTIDGDNNATLSMQPTVAESKALTPEAVYNVEAQLRDAGDTYVTTPVTGTVKIEQDYVI
jgi:predicted membrane-bound spermidine synthase